MNVETVYELKKLYSDLADIDAKLTSMLRPHAYRASSLYKVTFTHQTATFSGSQDYEPKHTIKTISEAVVCDMKIERGLLVTRIHSLGFETPEMPVAPH